MRKCLAIGLLGLFASFLGCAGEVGDIDRTQPDYVPKSYFNDGNPWYVRKQVVDVPYTTGFTFVGEMGDTEKIIWDIHEDYLIAYRAHEHIVDSEQYAVDMANQNRGNDQAQNEWKGAAIVAYPIKSHFDIQRQYNAQTGEETNVIEENSSDRHWYDRQYMRVDWSKNLVADFTFVASNIRSNPMNLYIPETELDNPDRAYISPDYMDFVEKIFAEPLTDPYVDAYYGRRIPTCWLWSGLHYDCLGQEVKIRTSFLKVDQNNDYEPLQYDDNMFAKYGYFRSEQYVYDHERDLLDKRRNLHAQRWNLWKRSLDDNGNAIPYPDREVKPILFYLSENFPDNLRGRPLDRVEQDWNRSFKETIMVLQGKSSLDEVEDAFVICNNPVTSDDHPACGCPDRIADPNQPHCGNVGMSPRLGDLRYSFLYWVAHPQAYSPLGYGPSAADLETGEIISGSAHMYGGALDTYAVYARDIINLINGVYDPEDFADGKHIVEYVDNLKTQKAAMATHRAPVLPQDMREIMNDMSFTDRVTRIQQTVESGVAYHDHAAARREGVAQSPMLAALMNDEVTRAIGGAMADPVTGHVPEMTPQDMIKWLGRDARMEEALQMQLLTRNCVYMPEFLDSTIISRAAKYRNMDQDELLQALKEEIFVGVTIHEIGHTVGLRHNFAASTDAINYFDGYWDFRLEHTVDNSHPDGFIPRWAFDIYESLPGAQRRDMDALWNAAGINEYQYSSIMDYGARFNSDFQGLGRYDDAAIRFGYGQLVEVFDFENFPVDNLNYLTRPSERHYTTYPRLLSPEGQSPEQWIENMRNRKVVPYEEVKTSAGQPDALVEVPYRFCSDEHVYPMGYPASWFCNIWDEGADMYEIMNSYITLHDQYYVFNNFRRDRALVTDYHIYSSYIRRLFRTFNNMTSLYKHFVNDEFIVRRGVTCPDLSIRARGTGVEWYDTGETTAHYAGLQCGYDRLLASFDMMDFFKRIIATPDVGHYAMNEVTGNYEMIRFNENYPQCRYLEPGDEGYEHCFDDQGNFDPDKPVADDTLYLGPGIGKHQVTKYDRDEYGYYFYSKPVRIGTWWDKVIAMISMADPYTNFMGVDASADTRSFLINTKALFSDEVMNLIGGFVAKEPKVYAPRLRQGSFGNLELVYPSMYGSTPTDLPAVDPYEQYTAELYSAFIAASEFSWGTDDQDFVESMRVFLKGSGEEFDLPDHIDPDDEDQVVYLTNPVSNRTYWATKWQTYGYQPSHQDAAGYPVYEPTGEIIPIGYTLLKNLKDQAGCPGPNCDPYEISWRIHYINLVRNYAYHAERPGFW